jgi:hypothetical protein
MTKGAKLGTASAGQLAGALDSLVRMYRAHASREDTIEFPAWKQTLSASRHIRRMAFGHTCLERGPRLDVHIVGPRCESNAEEVSVYTELSGE